MNKSFFFLLIFSLLPMVSGAQEPLRLESESPVFSKLFRNDSPAGEIRLIQEAKLDEILLLFMEQNRKLGGIPCYWIRIYSGSAHDSREEAYEIKAQFLKKYEGIRNDVIYDDPNFKVYIGGYRSKSEAQKVLNTIHRDFPTAFIVYDIIDFPDR